MAPARYLAKSPSQIATSWSSVTPSLPHFPMTKFLTVKEAAKIIGKSPSSIRRIIYPILENNRHPDRHHIEPDAATAKALRVKGENFAWKLSEELLRRETPEGGAKALAESKASGTDRGDQSRTIIDMLRKELEIKNSQIATQNELLIGLSERLREGNILMGKLQQQLSLSDGSTRNKADVVDADSPVQKPEEGIDASVATPKKTHWLFRKIF